MIEQKIIWRGQPSQWIYATRYAKIVLFVGAMAALNAAGLFDVVFNNYLTFLSKFSAVFKTVLFLGPLLYAMILWLQIKFHIYELSEEVFREHYGILNRTIDELELYRVNDTMTYKPFDLNLLGMGNVILHTSDASDPEVIIAAVKDPDNVRQMVRHYVEIQRRRKGIVEVANR